MYPSAVTAVVSIRSTLSPFASVLTFEDDTVGEDLTFSLDEVTVYVPCFPDDPEEDEGSALLADAEADESGAFPGTRVETTEENRTYPKVPLSYVLTASHSVLPTLSFLESISARTVPFERVFTTSDEVEADEYSLTPSLDTE